jgi:hypothetical protein
VITGQIKIKRNKFHLATWSTTDLKKQFFCRFWEKILNCFSAHFLILLLLLWRLLSSGMWHHWASQKGYQCSRGAASSSFMVEEWRWRQLVLPKPFYQTTHIHILEDSNLHSHCQENFTSHIVIIIFTKVILGCTKWEIYTLTYVVWHNEKCCNHELFYVVLYCFQCPISSLIIGFVIFPGKTICGFTSGFSKHLICQLAFNFRILHGTLLCNLVMFDMATLKFICLGVSDFTRTLFYTKIWTALLYYLGMCTQ